MTNEAGCSECVAILWEVPAITRLLTNEEERGKEGRKHLGRVVRKPANANPGLKVNRRINFCCVRIFFTASVFSGSRLRKLRNEGQII